MLTINYHNQAHDHYIQLERDNQHRLDKHIQRVFINQYQPVRKHQRALGHHEPPQQIAIRGVHYQHCRTFKHDTWSAIALYTNCDSHVMCRFNRCVTLWGLPMAWLSRYLARRERKILQRLADSPYFPDELGPIHAYGKYLPYAVAFTYAPGWPLNFSRQISHELEQQLTEALQTMHQKNMAHMDVHGSNIILTQHEKKKPYFIDLQTAFLIPNNRLGRSNLVQKLLNKCQHNDHYRLNKLVKKFSTNAVRTKSNHQKHSPEENRSKLVSGYRAIRLMIKSLRKKAQKTYHHKKHQYLPQQAQQGHLVVDEYIIEYRFDPYKQQLDILKLSLWQP